MNYELCKQLKDAGFPQKKLPITGVYAGVCKHGYFGFSEGRESCDCGEAETVHFPTLAELIEACGDVTDFSLQRCRDGWWAGSSDTDRILEEENPSGKGETPEVAVAKLWRALNTKTIISKE